MVTTAMMVSPVVVSSWACRAARGPTRRRTGRDWGLRPRDEDQGSVRGVRHERIPDRDGPVRPAYGPTPLAYQSRSTGIHSPRRPLLPPQAEGVAASSTRQTLQGAAMKACPRPAYRSHARRRLAAALAVLAVSGATHLPGSAAAAADPVGRWPLTPSPRVLRSFQPPPAPWAAGHRGVDLLGRPGQEVTSALPGRVLVSTVIAGRGVVVVGHGATRTTYEPLEARVPVGEEVAPGARLGVLSPVGSHCLPASCLHWGWRRGERGDGAYLDPLRLVGPRRVRLLPLDTAAAPSAVPPFAPRRSAGRRTGQPDLRLADVPGGRRVAGVR